MMDTRSKANRAKGRGKTNNFAARRAALALIASRTALLKRRARRYSLCGDDAEDAYQRSVEILIAKAPSEKEAKLLPWIQTVIKREALAIRSTRLRLVQAGDHDRDLAASPSDEPGPEEMASRAERAARSGEALKSLKYAEQECLMLKAQGYSYNEITRITGYSWTKVNRSISEGRSRFFKSFHSIEQGHECERIRPMLAAMGSGKIPDADVAAIRLHLRSCSTCRAWLRVRRSPGVRPLNPWTVVEKG